MCCGRPITAVSRVSASEPRNAVRPSTRHAACRPLRHGRAHPASMRATSQARGRMVRRPARGGSRSRIMHEAPVPRPLHLQSRVGSDPPPGRLGRRQHRRPLPRTVRAHHTRARGGLSVVSRSDGVRSRCRTQGDIAPPGVPHACDTRGARLGYGLGPAGCRVLCHRRMGRGSGPPVGEPPSVAPVMRAALASGSGRADALQRQAGLPAPRHRGGRRPCGLCGGGLLGRRGSGPACHSNGTPATRLTTSPRPPPRPSRVATGGAPAHRGARPWAAGSNASARAVASLRATGQ